MLSRHFHTIILVALVNFFASFHVFAATIPANGVSIVAPANPTSVPKYAKVELLVNLTTSSTQPFNPNSSNGGIDLSATFTAPNQTTQKVNGFYDGTSWRVRFTPTQTGTWTFTVKGVDSGGTANWSGGSFTCVTSSYPGFARIDGLYLRFSEGQAQFAIGHNNGWQYNVEQPTMSDMVAQGENLLSFWMNAPWITPADSQPRAPIENITQGLGNYNQPACAYMDSVVSDAETSGVYLLPSIWSHGNLRYWNPNGSDPQNHPWGPGWWSNNAYSAICTATNFFQTKSGSADTAQWTYQQNFYRYLLARWGYSRAIVGWVALVEIEGTTGFGSGGQPIGYTNTTQATAWCGAVRNYFAANDSYRLNTLSKYPIAVSQTDWTGGANTWASGCDIQAVDSYAQQTNSTAVASQIGNDIGSMRSTSRPALIAEFGAQEPNSNYNTYQPKHLHNGIWAGAASGGTMTPLLWCDEGQFPMLTDTNVGPQLRAQLQNLSQFMSGISYIDATGFTKATISATGLNAWAMRLTDRGFGWVQNAAGNVGGQTVTISNLTPGTYNVLWYDTWISGSTPLSAQPQVITVSSAGQLSAIVPSPTTARADLAFKFFLNGGPSVSNVASASPNPATGTTTTLSVLGADDSGEANLKYTWSVSGPAVVTFSVNNSNAAKSTLATFTRPGNYTFTVTVTDAENASTTSSVTVAVNQTATNVTVSPTSVTLPENGTQQFTATVSDQFGTVFSPALSWSAGDGGTISSSGLFTAGTTPGGPFTVTATAGSVSGTAAVVIINAAPQMTSATASPSTVAGNSTSLSATASDDGGEAALTYNWSSTPAGGVTFSANGTNDAKNCTATFAAAGSYLLSVTATDASGLAATGSVTVTVAQTATTVVVSPPSASVVIGQSQQYAASVSDQFGATISNAAVTWTAAGGSITSTGLYTAGTAAGTYTVTAIAGSVAGIAVIDVTNAAPAIQTVTATPDASGTSAQLAASVADDGGEAALTYTWSVSSSPAGATVSFSDNGTNTAKNAVATFNASGVYTLSLTSTDAGGLSSSETVDVQISATPTTITITPANPSVAINTTQQFSASVADQFGAAILNPAVTWSPGDMIDQSGLFSAGGTTGTYTITATAGGVSAGTSVVVYDVNAAPSIVSVNSTPATGTTSTLSVAATDDGGESALAYAWSVLSTPPGGSATFSANGSNAAKTSVATFTALGTYTIGITATDVLNASASSSLTVTVVQTPTVVTVAPGSATIPTNGVQQFNATVYDQFSAIIPSNAVTVTWSAGGSISQSGLYTAGIVPGTFPITATAGSASGNASITVQNTAPSITALNATPGIVTGTTTSLSATAGDDAGEPALTYTWSLLSAPIGGGVTFSANVSNGAKNATATFALSGTYSLTLTVRDAGGLTATRNVTVQVNQTATSLTLSPLSVTLTLNQTQQFTAKVYDQFGKPMSTAIGWSASSGGSISSSGLFTASKTGNFTVTASAAGLTQTATVKVNRK